MVAKEGEESMHVGEEDKLKNPYAPRSRFTKHLGEGYTYAAGTLL